MKINKYTVGATIAGGQTEGISRDNIPWIEVDATVFYTGRHRSDEQEWSVSDLEQMVDQFEPLDGDDNWSVPIQLDHSYSARDTIGYVKRLWVGQAEIDGELKDVLYGRLRYIGHDAIEKVKAKLWRKLSVSIYDESNTVREVTVTPFPQLAGATNHREGRKEEKMDKEIIDPAPAAEKAQEPVAIEHSKDAPVIVTHTDEIERMKREFSEQTKMYEAEKLKLLAKTKEQERVIKFAKITGVVNQYTAEGKTLPCQRDAELALVETLSDEQMELYKKYKDATPKLVNFSVIGSQDVETVSSYRQQSTTGGLSVDQLLAMMPGKEEAK